MPEFSPSFFEEIPMITKMSVTVVRWYELVKYLRISGYKFDSWSDGFFKTMKDARAEARKTPHYPLVHLAKIADSKIAGFAASRKVNCFCIIVPKAVALDQNSEISGQVLSGRKATLKPSDKRSGRKPPAKGWFSFC